MELGPKTKIDDLLSSYPFLLDFFLDQSPKFKILKNPFSRKTIGKVATMTQVASIGGIPLQQLLGDIARKIEAETGEQVTLAAGDGEAEPRAFEDEEARRLVLKEIIRDLHDGEDMESIKRRFQELVQDIDASEIASMEQALMEEGMPESEIKRLCDVHVEVFRESLEEQEAVAAPPGHPVHTFMLENRAAEALLAQLKPLLEEARADASGGAVARKHADELRRLLDGIAAIDIHYLRKENQLFPLLEKHSVDAPSQVMWALHDDVRDALRTARSELEAGDAAAAVNTLAYLAETIDDMIYKEEHILFPMAMETLSGDEWRRVRRGEEEIGYAWVEPEADWGAAEAAPGDGRGTAGDAADAGGGTAAGGRIELSTGHLTPEQIDLVMTHLPVEISFVDENDEVCYYSQVPHKIFPRSPGVIGRRVQKCHPSASLDRVQRILDEFKAGSKDSADFWIQKDGRFIYIRYFPVRDGGGNYRGTIEVVQDATELRQLSGEQRLLDWE